MKKVHVNEDKCLGCRLCEYWCAFAHSGEKYMPDAFNLTKPPVPRIVVEEKSKVTFAVACRHCDDAICVKSCIAGALSKQADGTVIADEKKCVGCHTCVLVCPFGAIRLDEGKAVKKCDLCLKTGGVPACVQHCPTRAIVYEER